MTMGLRRLSATPQRVALHAVNLNGVYVPCGCRDGQHAGVMALGQEQPEVDYNGRMKTARLHQATEPQNFLIFDRASIRDTNTHTSHEKPGALLLPGMASWGFFIDNQCDQSLTWQLLGGNYPDPSALANVGASGTVDANSEEPVLTDVYYKFLSLSIAYGVAPTTGILNVWANADPRL